ncbi:hypothetical protein M3J09_010141 [Ascochyta lentis]
MVVIEASVVRSWIRHDLKNRILELSHKSCSCRAFVARHDVTLNRRIVFVSVDS